MRVPRMLRALVSLALAGALSATTLQQLTLDDMIQQSTAVVHARITSSQSAYRGSDIYTFFQIQVLETWKTSGQTPTEVAVPGGVVKGIRQSVAGAPELKVGQDYVLFLWTSRSGLTQVIGLSQGIFKLSEESSGSAVAQRSPASELMLSKSGLPVEDAPVSMRLADLRNRVLKTLGAAK